MVKCSQYQCNECKTVFNASWYLWGYDGPFVIERHYDEHNADKQRCPECGSNRLSFIGKVHITRKERMLLTTNFEECKNLYYLFPPMIITGNQKLILKSE